MKRVSSFKKTPFYLIATPIGNLQEITPRAIMAIEAATFVCCEDTRLTGKLLAYLGIKKPLVPVHKFNEVSKIDEILTRIEQGEDGVFVSDAGYPLISDPGALLVKSLLEHDIPISVINGANALLPALIGSGLDASTFYFHGFLKGKDGEVEKTLVLLNNRPETLIFYEAPHRLNKTLTVLFKILGDRQVVIARELTKMHEEYIYTSLAKLMATPLPTLKGEMVIVVSGIKTEQSINPDHNYLLDIEKLIAGGYALKDATKILSILYGVSKNKLYDDFLNKQKP